MSNARFDAAPGRVLNNINMVRDVATAPECLSKLDQATVYAYNGAADDNFQIYHNDPSVLPRPPTGCAPAIRAGINGLTCQVASLVTPGQITNPPAGSKLTSASQVFNWSAGVGVSGYQLIVGTNQGASDIYSGPADASLSALVNGLPGFVTREADHVLQTTGLQIEGDKIVGIYVMRNPDKLRRVSDLRH